MNRNDSGSTDVALEEESSSSQGEQPRPEELFEHHAHSVLIWGSDRCSAAPRPPLPSFSANFVEGYPLVWWAPKSEQPVLTFVAGLVPLPATGVAASHSHSAAQRPSLGWPSSCKPVGPSCCLMRASLRPALGRVCSVPGRAVEHTMCQGIVRSEQAILISFTSAQGRIEGFMRIRGPVGSRTV
jgi:hypothetical protein